MILMTVPGMREDIVRNETKSEEKNTRNVIRVIEKSHLVRKKKMMMIVTMPIDSVLFLLRVRNPIPIDKCFKAEEEHKRQVMTNYEIFKNVFDTLVSMQFRRKMY